MPALRLRELPASQLRIVSQLAQLKSEGFARPLEGRQLAPDVLRERSSIMASHVAIVAMPYHDSRILIDLRAD